MEITTARIEANERARQDDFEYAFQSIIKNTAVLDRLLALARMDYVVPGSSPEEIVRPVEGYNKIIVGPFWANGKNLNLPAYLSLESEPIEINVPINLPRYSIVQVRGAQESYDNQSRSFYDPDLEAEVYHDIDTKTRLIANITLKHSQEGVNHAPIADIGYVKLAEIYMEPGMTAITQNEIKNVSAIHQGEDNIGWTTEKDRTFRKVELIEYLDALAAHREEDILEHPDLSVTTDKIRDKNVIFNKVQDIEADTTGTKASFSATVITFQTFLQTVWRGITWLNAKLHATSGHKHTGVDDDAPKIEASGIAANAVTTDKITNGSVTAAKLAANAVTTDKITNGSVTAAKLAANVETASLDDIYYIGKTYTQGPGDYTPDELKAMGKMPPNSVWEIWNHRANQYGLISGNLPAHTIYSPGSNYAANAYVMWHLEGDNWGLYKAKAAITNAAAQLDPVLWNEYEPAVLVDRKDLQGWVDSDFEIGDTISGDLYNGWKVCKIEVLGGKFASVAGGNRPPFGTGTAGDTIRNFSGRTGSPNFSSYSTGPFFANSVASYDVSRSGNSNNGHIEFNPSRVVPTGPEFSPRTFAVNDWRRVA